jgi:hypothetical protein
VQFAIADRGVDGNNYDVERIDGTGLNVSELERLLSSAGYRRYIRLAATLKVQRPANYAEGWVRLNRAHLHEIDILDEFISRPTKRPREQNREFHEEINLPLLEYLQTGLLTFKPEKPKPEVYFTARGGSGYYGRSVGQEDVICALTIYVGRFLCPLRYETTGKGEYRIDSSHGGDPNNPHSYPHLHVYHRSRGYHTTMRIKYDETPVR